ncbi:uncharacterized protein LOC121385102 [Gigantopelta aegis]|uniref:uncharacterized protein LOC121385102 n=1 Tax=Gigantopelta aegis TaxID=1735272 RepID=UPI001B88E4E1|nr:uncharacterized protein LOC121385102 [Gigantopelta aegis]
MLILKGRTCYCLENTNESKIRQDRDVSKCSGNFEEICGGRGKVSIYRLTFPKPEILKLTLKADSLGLCAYTSFLQYRQLQVKTGSNCSIPRGVAYSGLERSNKTLNNKICRIYFCTEKLALSYYTASSRYKLLKLTRKNSVHLYRASRRKITYWIGLSRLQRWRWTNGRLLSKQDLHDLNLSSTTFRGTGCLAVQHRGRGLHSDTKDCDTKLRAICYEGSTYPTSRPRDKDKNNQSGVAVGVSVTAVVVVGVVTLLAVFWMKRRRLYCFGEKPTSTPRDNPNELAPQGVIQHADTNPSPAGEGTYEKLDDITHTSQNTYENTPRQPEHVYSGLHTEYYNVTQSTNNVDP